ncbi:TetR/AcrR family transcriptional regulator [Altericroceibacterium endophyticum]|uniref:TetR family transcriptional regulator n=1 Tax=Altericroceibacterium endophyticum TaxID=1808508 RepID=A0A6I4T827_9SPHN|nr:TetR/AcrR family transcriptional regulator [Altericroceibacterium endophyticum]MXO66402.1 TetR family transcriptional regulator [Altericroceibacterium endophyticum]
MAGSEPKKRGKGRPPAKQSGVGREALIAATRELLQESPPALVTASAIARQAGGDPALVRYYFGNRENLLLEVAKRIGEESNQKPPTKGDPVELLGAFIHATFRFTRSARNMQRLMIDELDSTSSPEMRESVREWNKVPVDYYAGLQELDDKGHLTDFNPLFLHLAVIGISDFFVTGRPLIELLVPEDTDMDELAQEYEAFVERLLLDGLRKRAEDADT